MTMKKGPHFSSKKSTKKWFYQLPLDVMYAKNRKNHFFVFFGIHYVQPYGHMSKKLKKINFLAIFGSRPSAFLL